MIAGTQHLGELNPQKGLASLELKRMVIFNSTLEISILIVFHIML